MSPYRVAALLDTSVFDLPDKPGKTETGAPWLSWANVGSYAGWYAMGSRPFDSSPEYTPSKKIPFWQAVYWLACEVGNGNLDAVHCVGPAILSLGGLGVTATSGFAQGLLGECLLTAPDQFLHHMARAMCESDAYVRRDSDAPVGWSFASAPDGRRMAGAGQIGSVVSLGTPISSFWTQSQRARARVWVECCSRLLRDQAFDKAQFRFLDRHVPSLLMDRTRLAIKWPAVGARDAWHWSAEQQAVWAATMVLAIEDEKLTDMLLDSASNWPVGDATATLRAMRENVLNADYPDTFQKRVINTQAKLQKIFRIDIGVREV